MTSEGPRRLPPLASARARLQRVGARGVHEAHPVAKIQEPTRPNL
jgi:hypothetical protein